MFIWCQLGSWYFTTSAILEPKLNPNAPGPTSRGFRRLNPCPPFCSPTLCYEASHLAKSWGNFGTSAFLACLRVPPSGIRTWTFRYRPKVSSFKRLGLISRLTRRRPRPRGRKTGRSRRWCRPTRRGGSASSHIRRSRRLLSRTIRACTRRAGEAISCILLRMSGRHGEGEAEDQPNCGSARWNRKNSADECKSHKPLSKLFNWAIERLFGRTCRADEEAGKGNRTERSLRMKFILARDRAGSVLEHCRRAPLYPADRTAARSRRRRRRTWISE